MGIKNLTKSMPEDEALLQAKTFLRNAILTRIHKYLGQYNELPEGLKKIVRNNWRGVQLTPELVSVSLDLKNNSPDPQFLLKLIEKKYPDSGLEILQPPYPRWATNLQFYHNRSLSPSIKENLQVTPFRRKSGSRVADNYMNSLDYLKKIWPESFKCVRELVRSIILVDGKDFIAASFPHFHGAVLVNPGQKWSQMHYLENLVHESGHLELNIRRMVDPLVLNSTEEVYSSIRKSFRPVLGVLHAAFILVRVNHLFLKMEGDLNYSPEIGFYEFKERYKGLLRNSIETLDEKARFTDKGSRLFEDLCYQAKECL